MNGCAIFWYEQGNKEVKCNIGICESFFDVSHSQFEVDERTFFTGMFSHQKVVVLEELFVYNMSYFEYFHGLQILFFSLISEQIQLMMQLLLYLPQF